MASERRAWGAVKKTPVAPVGPGFEWTQRPAAHLLLPQDPPAQTLSCTLNRMYNNSSMRISHIFLLPAVLPTTKLNRHGAEVTTAKTQDFRSQYLPALKSDVITYSFANILSSFCCYPVSNCDGSQASRLSAENPTGLMVLVTFIQHELWDLDNTGWHTFIVRTGMSSGLFCMLVKPLRPFHGSKTCARQQ